MARKNSSVWGEGRLGLLVVLMALLGASIYLVRNINTEKRASADSNTCSGSLLLTVSKDRVSQSQGVTLAGSSAGGTKYYVHVLAGGQKCSTNFDVVARVCDINGNNCGAWTSSAPWGAYRSGIDGIARIDMPPLANGTYKAKLKPRGQNVAWSNEISVKVDNSIANNQPLLDIPAYLKMHPGYTYIYKGVNALTGGTGTMRIQMEEKTAYCGINTIPWRFTKSATDIYWGPKQLPASTKWTNGLYDLRWMVVDPGFNYTANPAYNGHYWAMGHKIYKAFATNRIRDINFASYKKEADGTWPMFYASKVGRVPAYNLVKKEIKGSSYIDMALGESSYKETTGECHGQTNNGTGTSWVVRTEMDQVEINNPGYSYTGPALRVDYMEFGSSNWATAPWGVREEFFFVKNVGLVKVTTKGMNGLYNNTQNCQNDNDCLNETMKNPHTTATLDRYFHNPTLSAVASPMTNNYANNISTTRNVGYRVVVSPSYTGYLEARVLVGGSWTSPSKWYWAENGVVNIGPEIMANVPPGTYVAQFRVWVPNEVSEGETRIGDENIPWSNNVTVVVN